MIDKYYIPKIEEFHVGFEFELLTKNGIYINEIFITISKYTFDDIEDIINISRVKYLDKNDIVSLGWNSKIIPADNDSRYWYSNLISLGISIEHINYIIYYTIHDKHCNIFIDNYDTKSFNNYIFNGTIKNKSELKVLMEMLNIKI